MHESEGGPSAAEADTAADLKAIESAFQIQMDLLKTNYMQQRALLDKNKSEMQKIFESLSQQQNI